MLLLNYEDIPPDLLEFFEPVDTSSRKDVFEIATRPFKQAHFAVMPPKLVEPCILAGCPGRVCAECGEPWVRVVEKGELVSSGPNKLVEKPRSSNRKPGAKSLSERSKDGYGDLPKRETKTIGFAPTCTCNGHFEEVIFDEAYEVREKTTQVYVPHIPLNEHPYQPGIVLDPFFGSGTTGLVAEKLGRRWLGIELSAEYVEMAKDRLSKNQPVLPGIY